jgi:hypothetical protein
MAPFIGSDIRVLFTEPLGVRKEGRKEGKPLNAQELYTMESLDHGPATILAPLGIYFLGGPCRLLP